MSSGNYFSLRETKKERERERERARENESERRIIRRRRGVYFSSVTKRFSQQRRTRLMAARTIQNWATPDPINNSKFQERPRVCDGSPVYMGINTRSLNYSAAHFDVLESCWKASGFPGLLSPSVPRLFNHVRTVRNAIRILDAFCNGIQAMQIINHADTSRKMASNRSLISNRWLDPKVRTLFFIRLDDRDGNTSKRLEHFRCY